MHEDELEAHDARASPTARSTCSSARRSSSPASTSPTPTRSSSTTPTRSAWRSSTSCAAASAAAPCAPTPTCSTTAARALSETAQRRLQAIFEATELGAGFQIAMRDLEIRGAGNLLGAEQSGHIAAVGFDLYVRLLGEAVERLKAAAARRDAAAAGHRRARPSILDLPLTAYLPDAYIPDLNLRLAVYQRLSQAAGRRAKSTPSSRSCATASASCPPPARNLLWVVRLRLLAPPPASRAIQTENEPAGPAPAPRPPHRARGYAQAPRRHGVADGAPAPPGPAARSAKAGARASCARWRPYPRRRARKTPEAGAAWPPGARSVNIPRA